MKRLSVIFIALLGCSSAWAQSSYYHDYKSFFGKEDRLALFSDKAKILYSDNIRRDIIANTLLVDCGSKEKPATGFIANFEDGQRIVTAAHNVQMAADNSRPCIIKRQDKPDALIHDFKPSQDFKNSATLLDTGFDIAVSNTKLPSNGFNICKSFNLNSDLVVAQSYDGKGYLTLSPSCHATKITKHMITTTCRGHYKASGAPLLAIQDDTICVAGVFNAHSGSLMEYEGYAARMRASD